MNSSVSIADYEDTIKELIMLNGYKDTGKLIKECQDSILYDKAQKAYISNNYDEAIKMFERLGEFKDSRDKVDIIQQIKKDVFNRQQAAIKKKKAIVAVIVVVLTVIICWRVWLSVEYNKAVNLMNQEEYLMDQEDYEEADEIFEKISYWRYKKTSEYLRDCHEKRYQEALELYNNREYQEALDIFEHLSERKYKDSSDYADKCTRGILSKLGVKVE
jgi:tetratricopeptide (TPR) repeat protein